LCCFPLISLIFADQIKDVDYRVHEAKILPLSSKTIKK